MPGGVSGRLPGSCPAHARQVQPGLNVPPGGREAPLSLGRPRAARSVTDSLDRNPHCLALSAASFLLSGRRQRAGSETGTLSRPEPKHLVRKPGGSDRVRVPICAPSVMGPRTPALCAPGDFWTHAACPAHRGLGRMNRGDKPLCAGETGVARSPPGPLSPLTAFRHTPAVQVRGIPGRWPWNRGDRAGSCTPSPHTFLQSQRKS